MNITIPKWAKQFPENNKLKVTKLSNGIAEEINFSLENCDNLLVFGRSPDCGIVINEVSCSRQHAIICYGINEGNYFKINEGAYWICDFKTQNGTLINNNQKLKPMEYELIRNGYFVQFGVSDEKYLIEYEQNIVGIDDDLEIEIKKDISASENSKQMNVLNKIKTETAVYANWGQIDELDQNKDVISNKDPAPAIDDPVQVVRGFFHREGYEFSPKFTKLTVYHKTVVEVTLALPLDDINDDESNETTLTAQEDSHSEALHQVCKIAYELLYSMDMLNRKTTESFAKKQKRQLIENDYYDSDDDTFYDRTGVIEQKRSRRIDSAQKMYHSQFIVSGSSKRKSYFDKTVEYIPSKKIKSRLTELNKLIIRTKSELQRAKESNKNSDNRDQDDEAEKVMAESERNEITKTIKLLSDKMKTINKEKESLLESLEYSKEVESQPQLVSDLSEVDKDVHNEKNSQKDGKNSIIDEIIKSYTDFDHSTLTSRKTIKSSNSVEEKPKIVQKVTKLKKPENIATSNQESHSNNQRDMIETEKEEQIDDSPVCWTPQTNVSENQDILKKKYGY